MEHADQGEQAPGGVEIHLDLAGEAFLEQLGGFVVQGAAGHVDRLDAPGAVAAHRFEIGIADREIVADRAAEAGEADADRARGSPPPVAQLDREPASSTRRRDAERPVMAGDVEMIALEQVEDGDSPLLLDVGVAPEDRALVELDVDDPGVGHARLLAGAALSCQHQTSGVMPDLIRDP